MTGTTVERAASDDRVRRFRPRTAGTLVLTGVGLTVGSAALQQRASIPRGEPLAVLAHIWFLAAAGLFGVGITFIHRAA